MLAVFFYNRDWRIWSWGGLVVILGTKFYTVQLDVYINELFGNMFDLVGKLLRRDHKKDSHNARSYHKLTLKWIECLVIKAFMGTCLHFFSRHYFLRWRQAMTDCYIQHWDLVHDIEGSSQRIQEDTMRFTTMLEHQGLHVLQALMTICSFLPVLWKLSPGTEELPFVGHVDHGLVWVVILWSLLGTGGLFAIAAKLPGLEYLNQVAEALYRKELVHGEDWEDRAQGKVVAGLFNNVRKNYFMLFLNYLYVDAFKEGYWECNHMLPYILLAPALTESKISVGKFQKVRRTFERIEWNMQFFLGRWHDLVELLSVCRRLHEFNSSVALRQQDQSNAASRNVVVRDEVLLEDRVSIF